jgi:hypothetical protein
MKTVMSVVLGPGRARVAPTRSRGVVKEYPPSWVTAA